MNTEIRWSKWVELKRKDVECAFGILKGWWHILKTGIRVQGIEVVDKVWLTCCALHNWLLQIDGLDVDWDMTSLPAQSEWEGELGEMDCEGLSPNLLLLATSHELPPRNYDTSGIGPGNDVVSEERHPVHLDRERFHSVLATTNNTEARKVSDLGLGYFRSRLVEHFDILFKQNKIKWPVSRGCHHNPSQL